MNANLTRCFWHDTFEKNENLKYHICSRVKSFKNICGIFTVIQSNCAGINETGRHPWFLLYFQVVAHVCQWDSRLCLKKVNKKFLFHARIIRWMNNQMETDFYQLLIKKLRKLIFENWIKFEAIIKNYYLKVFSMKNYVYISYVSHKCCHK